MGSEDMLHPEDRARVEHLVEELKAHRRRLGLTGVGFAKLIGRTGTWTASVDGQPNRRFSTLQRYAYGLGLRISFNLEREPPFVDSIVDTLAATARGTANHEKRAGYERAELSARLRAVRLTVPGRRQAAVADAAGIERTYLSKIESHAADDPLLGHYQRIARALGHPLFFVLVRLASVPGERVQALLADLAESATAIETQCGAETKAGRLDGIDRRAAQALVEELGGVVVEREMMLLPTGHTLLAPWREVA